MGAAPAAAQHCKYHASLFRSDVIAAQMVMRLKAVQDRNLRRRAVQPVLSSRGGKGGVMSQITQVSPVYTAGPQGSLRRST